MMSDPVKEPSPGSRLGPALFIITLVIVLEFFWWFMSA